MSSELALAISCLIPLHLAFAEPVSTTLLNSPTPAATIEQFKPLYKRPAGSYPLRPQPIADEDAARELGKALFFDRSISRSGALSCASCHNPERGWVDGRPRSIERGSRRSMPLENLAWDTRFTWAGNAPSLASQAVLALTAAQGMNTDLDFVFTKLRSSPTYPELFARAFQGKIPAPLLISTDTIALALERYVSSIVSGPAPFDRWISGDETAISEPAKRGFLLFNTKAQCSGCHAGWRLTDGGIHDLGIDQDPGFGGFEISMAHLRYHMKTMGLRNIEKRAPYMHNGSQPTLEAVIKFYNDGGGIARPTKARQLVPLHLSSTETQELLAFLLTLTSDHPEAGAPK